MDEPKIILDLCGGSGSWSKPYKDAGYDVRLVTLPDGDVLTYIPPENVYGILAAPPCTEFSIAKNRDIPRDLEGGLMIVNACLAITTHCKPKFWALENPIGLLSKFLGKPKYQFQPWWFGDEWTKHTMVWGDFNIPERKYFKWEDVPKTELYVRPRRFKPAMASFHKSAKNLIPQLQGFSALTDADFRSITPPGFAQAFFKANP